MDVKTLTLEGDLTITSAEIVRDRLGEFITADSDKNFSYEIKIDSDADIDLVLIQLLVSAYRVAHDAQLSLTLSLPLPDQLEFCLRQVGLMQPEEQQINQDRILNI